MRDPIALAYLLARATDTIADTATIDAELRETQLQNLAALIRGDSLGQTLAELRATFAPQQKIAAERALIESLPSCFEWLAQLPPNDQLAIREVLREITRGQLLDLQRFGKSDRPGALATAAELEDYTYLVAGCVGKFWTRIYDLHLPDFADRSEAEMSALGIAYGRGLQLINILRDAGEDLRAGRCYLPLEELHSLGLEPAEVLREPARVEPLLAKWRGRAAEELAQGLAYAASLWNFRVRFATVLPALIGARTLELLEASGGDALQKRVKVPRAEMRKIIFEAVKFSFRKRPVS